MNHHDMAEFAVCPECCHCVCRRFTPERTHSDCGSDNDAHRPGGSEWADHQKSEQQRQGDALAK